MRGHVIGRPTLSWSPFTLRAYQGTGGWIGQVFSGSAGKDLHVSLALTPLPTRDAALDLAFAWARKRAKDEGVPFPGADRPTGEVRVLAEGRPYSSGDACRAARWVQEGTPPAEMVALFAPGFRIVSIDGKAAA